ncbi:MAG: universal stress protein, partial [Aldersonia sp.]|nr:universal stress protein [Aldersonia sp.]
MDSVVIVGADGSDQALQAVRWAATEAKRRDATL